ncbi:MAG TPA: CBS domain-containing protein [Candidatus Dormibacteraeota bacterium]|nr:CBS domain-containing protein [Candidatus Dormibacteraeota bacterium]
MEIRTFVSPEVVRGEVTEPIWTLAMRMRAHGVGSLPLFEGERLAGILTERDVLAAVADGVAETAVAAAYMTPEPVTAEPSEDSAQVAERMLERGVRHLPVVEHGRLIGMVSARDLLALEAWPGRGRVPPAS